MKHILQNKLLRVLSLNSISVAVSLLLGIASTKIVSVFLGAQGMALLGSIRNFSAMAKSTATLGITTSAVKLVAENRENKAQLSVIYSTFFWIFLSISFLLGITIVVCSNHLSRLLFFGHDYAIILQFFGLSLPLIVLNVFWTSIYNGFEEFKKIIKIQIISNVLVFVTTALLIWKFTLAGGLYAILVGEIMMVFVTFLFVWRDGFFEFNLTKTINSGYFNIIKSFSSMALLSAIVVPVTSLFIRDLIINQQSIVQAGLWDAINRLSGFYMILFSSGLSMYYMPKLASIHTDSEFKRELIQYFKIIFPLFFLMVIGIFFFRHLVVKIAFTAEFAPISRILIWQLLGDLTRIATLAFGYQILVKAQVKRYFFIEIFYNVSYVMLSYHFLKSNGIEGVLKSYLIANIVTLVIITWMFRSLFWSKASTKSN